jgi:transmembrane sensor
MHPRGLDTSDLPSPELDQSGTEAVVWLSQINRGLRTEEIPSLRKWLAEASNRHTILEMARLRGPDVVAVLAELCPAGPEPMKSRFWRRILWDSLRIGSVLGLIVLAWSGQTSRGPLERAWARLHGLHVAPMLILSQGTYTTAAGEARTLELSDKTIVTLTGNTRLTVNYSLRSRNVYLLTGEATFHVAKDPKRRFFVAAGRRQLEASGTNFNVQVMTPDKVMFHGDVAERVDALHGSTVEAYTDWSRASLQ